MPKKLRTLCGLGLEVLASFILKYMRVIFRNGIPNFGCPFMNVVQGREIEVLLVPTKKSLP